MVTACASVTTTSCENSKIVVAAAMGQDHVAIFIYLRGVVVNFRIFGAGGILLVCCLC